MSCLKLSRQSLHLVLKEGKGLYSLRHMDVSKLFYASTEEALEAEADAKMKKKNGINKIGSFGRLPRPSIHYKPHLSAIRKSYNSVSVLASCGEGRNKILCSDSLGNTNLYDTKLRSLSATPPLNSPKGPSSLAVSIPGATDSLYIMDMSRARSCCFEVLAYDSVGSLYWDPLPMPPFFKEPEFKTPIDPYFAVVDSTRICVSTTTATYCFDTVTREWNMVGDWVLPFKAEYAPELGLCIGLAPQGGPYDLCILDNFSTAAGSSPPTVQHIGEEFELPKHWWQVTCNLLNLGSRRFCIANSFMVDNPQDECDSVPVTVFTGVEVLPSELGLRMVKHKSKSFFAFAMFVL